MQSEEEILLLLLLLWCLAGPIGGANTEGSIARLPVSKNGLFEPFLHKNEHFTKTGSGQT